MMKVLVVVLLVDAAASAARYPRYVKVARNPKDFDMLYGSTTGPLNETWYFGNTVNLTSIVIPSQIFNFWSPVDPWTSGTYKEEVDLFLYELKLTNRNYAVPHTYLAASGSFNGTVRFGQELDIPLWNATLNGPPPVQKYANQYTGYKYIVNIVFKRTGIYPWYTARNLGNISPVLTSTNGAGIVIGLTYTIF